MMLKFQENLEITKMENGNCLLFCFCFENWVKHARRLRPKRVISNLSSHLLARPQITIFVNKQTVFYFFINEWFWNFYLSFDKIVNLWIQSSITLFHVIQNAFSQVRTQSLFAIYQSPNPKDFCEAKNS